MIITHELKWNKCLSHQIWPHIKKGWKDTPMKPIHFFWGLAGNNIAEIRKCIENKEEYWFVDTGYLSKQIDRYPEPKILDEKRTYFRICKGSFHTNKGKVNTPARYEKLIRLGIDAEFKGWRDTGKHILLCPSSQTVTYQMNGISQEEWIKTAIQEISKYTDREIRLRNKPRPGNKWWNTDIKDDLKDCYALVTNYSLSAFDALLNYIPVFAEANSVMGPVTSRDISKIEKPLKPGRKTMEEWLKFVSENQFTLKEMASGKAYEILKYQND